MITGLLLNKKYRVLAIIRKQGFTHYILEDLSNPIKGEGDIIHYKDEKKVFRFVNLPVNGIFTGEKEEKGVIFLKIKNNGKTKIIKLEK
jgi:hypothetical protein